MTETKNQIVNKELTTIRAKEGSETRSPAGATKGPDLVKTRSGEAFKPNPRGGDLYSTQKEGNADKLSLLIAKKRRNGKG